MLLKSICLSTLVLSVVLAKAQEAYQAQFQLGLLALGDGDTLNLPAGIFKLQETLLLDGLADVVIVGAGQDETVLQFSKTSSGAEGLKVTNCDRLTLRDFSVRDTPGDAIKTQACTGITFHRIETSWTGKPSSDNGAYGLYPVQCSNVLIDSCTARGASDAGIYVGQSDQVVVRNCTARENVAGIEIENTTHAEVVDNLAEHNTGGILIFDLPDLIKKRGGHVLVHRNRIIDNNLGNFAPAGNIVGQVPPGTGVMVLGTSDVLVHNNEIHGHRTTSVAVVSYYITELPIQDEQYDPFPSNVRIADNTITRQRQWPALSHKIGKLLALKFGRKVPPILYDGITPETLKGEDSQLHGLCISRNNADFALLDAARKFRGLERNPTGFECGSEASVPGASAKTAKQ